MGLIRDNFFLVFLVILQWDQERAIVQNSYIIMLLRFSDVRIIDSKKVSDATCNSFRFTKPSHNETKATHVKVRPVVKWGSKITQLPFTWKHSSWGITEAVLQSLCGLVFFGSTVHSG